MCCATAGKGKLPAEGEGGEGGERPCLEVLLGLPARPISRRSEGHLNQSLEVRVVCSACGWLAGQGWINMAGFFIWWHRSVATPLRHWGGRKNTALSEWHTGTVATCLG